MDSTDLHDDATGGAEVRPIGSLDDLRNHVQWAIELEHATMPPYLCALYSLDPARNATAAEIVQSVFVEEMLHLTLAANLLNAIGGAPVLDAPRLLPGYPRTLPHGAPALRLELRSFGPQALEDFLMIEHPSPPRAAPEADRYETIGQFYAAIEVGLRYLCESLGEDAVFTGDPSRQIGSSYPYGGAGRIISVTDLASALDALAEIVEQGEGASAGGIWDNDRQMFHPDRDEVAHYYRFEELKQGRQYQQGDTPKSGPTGPPLDVDWDGIRPLRSNQRLADVGVSEDVKEAQRRFNDAYCTLLWMLEQAFNGDPSILGTATKAMFGLKAQARELMAMPLGDGTYAAPTFEYVDPDVRA